MTWCLGVLVLAAWAASERSRGGVVGVGYFAAVLYWLLVGLGALTVAVVRMVSSKMGPGVAGVPRVGRPAAPAEKREV